MVARNSAARATTDILKEPITSTGLRSRLEILPGSARVDYFEAVSFRESIEKLAEIAAALRSEAAGITNVVDLRTRQPYRGGSVEILDFSIVDDAAPGRHSTGYAIFEASGPRAIIQQLAKAASAVFGNSAGA